jgi:hypothetical protein
LQNFLNLQQLPELVRQRRRPRQQAPRQNSRKSTKDRAAEKNSKCGTEKNHQDRTAGKEKQRNNIQTTEYLSKAGWFRKNNLRKAA